MPSHSSSPPPTTTHQPNNNNLLLPLLPTTTSNNNTLLLLLDLDQTLVFSSFKPLPTYDFTFHFRPLHTNACTTVYVVKRPGVDRFLLAMAGLFDLVVFTAATKSYADPLLDLLDPGAHISHRLYRDSCVQDEDGGFVKDLSRLGRDLEKVIIVDDDPKAYKRQPRNAVAVSSFKNEKKDRELLDLIPILSCVAAENSNVIESLRKQKEKSSAATRSGRMKSFQYERFLHGCYWE